MSDSLPKDAKDFIFISYLGKFKPISFFAADIFDSNIGLLRAMTKNTSVCSEWHHNLYIETERENHTKERKIVGFNIWTLRPKSKWLPIFLISVFKANLRKNKRENIPNKECFKVYAQVFWLIITNPRLCRITN